jgi:hypothetical protein
MAYIKAAHHRGTHQARAKRITDAAYRNPHQTCWRCGLTLTEIQARYPRRRVHWTGGHLIDGLEDGPMAPECSPCNYTDGQRLAQLRRQRTAFTW